MEHRPRRSILYMPATSEKAVAKARELPCDAMILDLEDAVAPDAKAAARAAAVAAVRAGGFGRRELIVRVNALDGPWGEDDLKALSAAWPDAVLVPKVDDADGVAAYRALAGGVPIWAMVETMRAVLGVAGLAGAEGLAALVVGTNDLAKEMRAKPGADRAPFQGFLAATVAAARANGLAAIDGVYNAIGDAEGFAAECAQGVAFGFDGKTLIHPSQLAACNAAFSPDAAEIAWARVVVAAFAEPGAADKGVIKVEGKMVERLHLDEARRVLAVVEAIGEG
jgi:citrate lyase subunit beta / citryl-CoA lyase